MRILIADDQAKVRFGLRVWLERQPGNKTVGEVGDVEDLLVRTQVLCPDLILLDWELAGMAANDLLRALHEICPAVRVIALSGKPEVREAALCAGVDAFVSKADSPQQLLSAISDCLDRAEDKTKSNPEPVNK